MPGTSSCTELRRHVVTKFSGLHQQALLPKEVIKGGNGEPPHLVLPVRVGIYIRDVVLPDDAIEGVSALTWIAFFG